MRVFTSAFDDGELMPARFATTRIIGGANASPPLHWENEPEGTRSFVLSVIDHHPVAKHWVHWLVTDIPANVHSLAEGASPRSMPAGAVEMTTSWDKTGYDGPQPPPGTGPHDYVFTLNALDVDHLDTGGVTDWAGVERAMRGHVLADAEVMGKLGR